MRIHRLTDRFASSYLIETPEALALVDAGFLGHERLVARAVDRIGRSLDELGTALVTHGHPDHVGGLAALQRRTDLRVGTHALHEPAVAAGRMLISPGLFWGSRIYEAAARRVVPRLGFAPVSDTFALKDGARLDEHGIPGRVIHTPGHSEGCVSVLLDDGTAIVGDLAQGPRVPGITPVERPNMALRPELVLDGWRRMLDAGATRFLPAHGAPFTAADLAKRLARLERLGPAARPNPLTGG